MSGRIILGVANPALDANGEVDTGATLTFYKNGTTTAQAVYSASDLATPLSNPLSCDSAGRFPAIWAPEGQVYSVKWTPSGASAITYNDIAPLASLTLPPFNTKADAVAATISSSVSMIALAGYSAVGDAQELLLYKGQSSAPSHSLYFQSADGRYWVYVPGPNGVNVAAAGMLPSATDNSTAWGYVQTYCAAAASDATYHDGAFLNIFVPKTGVYKFTAQITWDPSIGGVNGNGTWWRFNTGASVNGIKVQCSNPGDGSAYRNHRSTLRAITIYGPGANSNNGLYMVPTSGSDAHFQIEGVSIIGWSNGINLSANVYLITFRDCAVYQCGQALIDNGDQANSGENVRFFGCEFFNNLTRAVSLSNVSADYHFFGCSFDYNGSGGATVPQMSILGTRANLTNCHIEGGANPAIIVGKNGSDAAYVTMTGCVLIQASTGGATNYIEVADGGTLRLAGGQAVVNNSTNKALKLNTGSTCSRYGFDFLTSATIDTASGTYNNYP